MISFAQIEIVTARRNASPSNVPSSSRNVNRFSDARLHAELSMCMYSLHGLLALMRPVFAHVCQSLIVVSYCIPGSPHSQAAAAILRSSSRAFNVCTTSPPTTDRRDQSRPSVAASMNASVTRTELFAFWNWMLDQASPFNDMSQPADPSAYAFRSSFTLLSMKSSTSGWSAFSTTILAARRVFPPDLIEPAIESAPRMKLMGPLACPPAESCSLLDRIGDRLIPEPDPPLKIIPSVLHQSRIDSIVSSTDRMKHALHCGFSSTPTLNQTGLLKAICCFTRRCVSSS